MSIPSNITFPHSYQGDYDKALGQLNTDLTKLQGEIAQLQTQFPTPDQIKNLAIFDQLETDVDNVSKLTSEMQNSQSVLDQEIVTNRDGLFGQVTGFFQDASLSGITFQSVANEDSSSSGSGANDLANYLVNTWEELNHMGFQLFQQDIDAYLGRH